MDISRLCSVQGAADDAATHQRISEYVKPKLDAYPGRGFTAEHEWTAEQTIAALREMLDDVRSLGGNVVTYAASVDVRVFRECVEGFLDAASKEIPGKP